MAQPALNTGWLSPTTNPANNGVTDPQKMYSHDSNRAQIVDAGGLYATLGGFGISPGLIPPGSEITGVEVDVEINSNTNGQQVGVTVDISINSGSSFSAVAAQVRTSSGTASYITVGSSSNKWGLALTAGAFFNDQLQVKISGDSAYSITTLSIDHVRVKVHFKPPVSGGMF